MSRGIMKRIGIIGGIGPESTVDYYKSIISLYRKRSGNENYPPIIINSINMTEMLNYVSEEDYESLVNQLTDSITTLKRAGADFAVIASNTPHVVFDTVSAKSPLSLISIVESTCERAAMLKLKRVLLIGTAFTMRNSFYADCFKKYSIDVFVPDKDEQEKIHNIIFPELEDGIVNPEKKIEMLDICNRLISREKIEGIVLGCTELPLMLKNEDFQIEVLNTAEIHVQAVVNELMKQRENN